MKEYERGGTMTEMNERDLGKLRGRVKEKFDTQKAFAEALGKDLSLVNQTLNGKRDIDQGEIEQWCETLEISKEEIPDYFFSRKVANMQQKEPQTVYEVPAA